MDRLDLSPVSRPVTPAGARVGDVAPPSVVHPGHLIGPLSAASFGGYAIATTLVVLLWHLM
jgi:hypothetical protein